MAFELGLRRFSLLPDFLQNGDDEPRKAHFLGKKEPTPVDQDHGRQHEPPPSKSRQGKYRDLTDITLGEVADVMTYFMPQMVASPTVGWVARNYFCELPFRYPAREQSPIVFGRVRTVYPADGNVQNIERMEMDFPRGDAAPDLLLLQRRDIDLQKPIQTYCVGVKMYLSQTEMQDFSQSENIFIEKGFAPIYETGYLDLLDMDEHNQSGMYWLNVIGSEWFASVPDSVQPEIRERLRNLLDWNKVILNYHPRRHTMRYLSLNDELDFNYGFTKHFLIAPLDTGQALQKVDQIFGEIFMQGMATD